MDIQELFVDKSNEEITAFAFNVGRMVDMAIKARNADREQRIEELESKLCFYRSLLVPDIDNNIVAVELLEQFDKVFGIVKCKKG